MPSDLIHEPAGVARECPECGLDGIISALECMRVYGRLYIYHEGTKKPHTDIDGLRYICDKCSAVWTEADV